MHIVLVISTKLTRLPGGGGATVKHKEKYDYNKSKKLKFLISLIEY